MAWRCCCDRSVNWWVPTACKKFNSWTPENLDVWKTSHWKFLWEKGYYVKKQRRIVFVLLYVSKCWMLWFETCNYFEISQCIHKYPCFDVFLVDAKHVQPENVRIGTCLISKTSFLSPRRHPNTLEDVICLTPKTDPTIRSTVHLRRWKAGCRPGPSSNHH